MKKSKKDLAFDKERAKFRAEIRQLKSDIQSKNMQIRELLSQIHGMESEMDKLKDWNTRLLEYMDMPEDDMRRILREKSIESEISETIESLKRAFCRVGRF